MMETVIHLGLGIYLICSAWFWLKLFRLTRDQEILQFDIGVTENYYRALFVTIGCILSAISVWLLVMGNIIEATVIFCVSFFSFGVGKRALHQLALKEQESFCRVGYKPPKFQYLLAAVCCALFGFILLVSIWR